MAVAIKRVSKSINEAVSDAMELASFRDYITEGGTVFLKVNLGWDMFIPGSVTNPAVFEGVVNKLKGYVKKLYVIESNQVLENVESFDLEGENLSIDFKDGKNWIYGGIDKVLTI